MDNKIKISSPEGLMLNSLVYNRHGDVHAIRYQDFSAWNHPDMGGNYGFYAIPLTEEWLVKFGFERADDPVNENVNQNGYEKDGFLVCVTGDGAYQYTILVDDPHYSFYHTTLEYVHQLQGLYFFTEGEVLEATNQSL